MKLIAVFVASAAIVSSLVACTPEETEQSKSDAPAVEQKTKPKDNVFWSDGDWAIKKSPKIQKDFAGDFEVSGHLTYNGSDPSAEVCIDVDLYRNGEQESEGFACVDNARPGTSVKFTSLHTEPYRQGDYEIVINKSF